MFKLFVLAAILATTSAQGYAQRNEVQLTNTFHYFNTGSATGCEHRDHYLYDERGSDCVWQSNPTRLLDTSVQYSDVLAKFQTYKYGGHESSDFVEVKLASCTSSSTSSCGTFVTTKLHRGGGSWYYYPYWAGAHWVKDRRSDYTSQSDWINHLQHTHRYIRIQVTLHSDVDHSERNYVDQLAIYGKVITTYPTSYPTPVPTSYPTSYPTARCEPIAITNTFTYFNTGSATGCEHRHHYLYDYAGSDCVWESPPTPIKSSASHLQFDNMMATFSTRKLGTMESADFVQVQLAACTSSSTSSCSVYATTKMDRGGGGTTYYWYWYSYQAWATRHGVSGDWLSSLNPGHSYIRMKVTLKSDHNYSERHMLDNLAVYGQRTGCTPTSYPTSYPTAFPTAYPTNYPTTYPTPYPTGYPTAFPTSFPTSYPTPQCSVTCDYVKNHHIQVIHDRTLIAHNLKNNAAHYAQHRCWHDGAACHCECSGTKWVGHGATKDKTSSNKATFHPDAPTCFFMEVGTYQYATARSKCQESDGADIASIHSAAENTLVRKLHLKTSKSGKYNHWWRRNLYAAYLGAEETSRGVWKWSDGSAWDYSPASTHGNYCSWHHKGNCKRLNDYGSDETRIAMSYDFGHQKWEDWGSGGESLHAICRSNYKVSDCAAMGGVSA